jgi:hypothetical protein
METTPFSFRGGSAGPPLRDRKFADSSVEQAGFDPSVRPHRRQVPKTPTTRTLEAAAFTKRRKYRDALALSLGEERKGLTTAFLRREISLSPNLPAPGSQLATSTVALWFFLALPFGKLGPASAYQVLGVFCGHNHGAVFAYAQMPARICLQRPDAVRRAKANPGAAPLPELLGLSTGMFEEAPTLHRGVEHFQSATAGVDLVVMGEFGEARAG